MRSSVSCGLQIATLAMLDAYAASSLTAAGDVVLLALVAAA